MNSRNNNGVLELKNTLLVNVIKKKIKYSEEMLDFISQDDISAMVLSSISVAMDDLRVKELKDISEKETESEYYSDLI